MDKNVFRQMFREMLEGHEEEDYEFQEFFRDQIKEAVSGMFTSEELTLEMEKEYDYYDSQSLKVKVKMDNNTICEAECRLK
jgi:hypothetical protein